MEHLLSLKNLLKAGLRVMLSAKAIMGSDTMSILPTFFIFLK